MGTSNVAIASRDKIHQRKIQLHKKRAYGLCKHEKLRRQRCANKGISAVTRRDKIAEVVFSLFFF